MEHTYGIADGEKIPPDRRKRKIVAAILIILLLVIALVVYWWMTDKGPEVIGNLKEGQLPGSEALREAEDDQVRIQINSQPVFADGKSEGNLYIGNPDTNIYDMMVTITLTDAEEQVYESGRIPPGYYIDNDKLQKVLSAGAYDAKASIVYYDGEKVQVSYIVNLEITVKN